MGLQSDGLSTHLLEKVWYKCSLTQQKSELDNHFFEPAFVVLDHRNMWPTITHLCEFRQYKQCWRENILCEGIFNVCFTKHQTTVIKSKKGGTFTFQTYILPYLPTSLNIVHFFQHPML